MKLNRARGRALPLLLLAAMLAIGLVIEQRRFGELLWETKVPAAALLAVAGWRLRRSGPAGG